MADLITLQARLAEAEAALHQLHIGSKAENVEHDGMRVTYTRADVSKLEGYIAGLKSQIAIAGGLSGLRRRAMVIDL